ncbi:MAG: hypothetical protein OEV73_00145 [Desulfobulbaceae bacterium]|nr:hypothetical protein [Desulfobulbaceae bacterium]
MAKKSDKITTDGKDFKGSGVEGQKDAESDPTSTRRALVRMKMICSAITELAADEYTEEGKPEVAALENLLGFDISADERDAAEGMLAAHQAAHEAGRQAKDEMTAALESAHADNKTLAASLKEANGKIAELIRTTPAPADDAPAAAGEEKAVEPATRLQSKVITGEHVLAMMKKGKKD